MGQNKKADRWSRRPRPPFATVTWAVSPRVFETTSLRELCQVVRLHGSRAECRTEALSFSVR
ncbi:hypothetical protein GCM10026982_26660 [Nocardiopsis aegyptia]